MLGLAECGSHAIVDAALGTYTQGKRTLTESIVRSGMLLLADRGFFRYRLWQMCADTAADLLWRMKPGAVLLIEKRYPDESFASDVYPGTKAHRSRTDGIVVRVIEYTLDVMGRRRRAISSGERRRTGC